MVIALMAKVYVQNDIMIIEQVKAKIKGPIEKLFGRFFLSGVWMGDGVQPSIILRINLILTICLIIYSLHQIIRFYNG